MFGVQWFCFRYSNFTLTFCLVSSKYSLNRFLLIYDRVSLCDWPQPLNPPASASNTAIASICHPVQLQELLSLRQRKLHAERGLRFTSPLASYYTLACGAAQNQACTTQRRTIPSGGE